MCLTDAIGNTSESLRLVLTVFNLHPGILTLTLTNPIWVTKTRLVLQYNADPTSKQYKGMIDALVKIYRHEGVPGLYKVSRCTVMECHNTSVVFSFSKISCVIHLLIIYRNIVCDSRPPPFIFVH